MILCCRKSTFSGLKKKLMRLLGSRCEARAANSSYLVGFPSILGDFQLPEGSGWIPVVPTWYG